VSPGRANKKGRHQWEMLGKKVPKKTEEEIILTDVSNKSDLDEDDSIESSIEEKKVIDIQYVQSNTHKILA
jgi:hypothetical protein